MNDNPLIAALIATVAAGMTAQGITVGIKQAYQPTQQGAPSTPYVLLHKVADKRYGWPERANAYNATTGVMTHTETVWLETTYQVDAIARQVSTDTTGLTAADYLKAVARTLQSDVAIESLEAQGIGILRIDKFQQTYWTDDRGQNETNPMFTFVVTHSDVLTNTVGSTATVNADMVPVDTIGV
jgi:hypothetical protein